SQNPDTKDYIIVFQDKFCKKCGEEYTSIRHNWCKPCQIDNLKGNFTNWTSGNEKINNFIQEMQLKINQYDDIVFEWIPYNQFSNIKEIGNNGKDSIIPNLHLSLHLNECCRDYGHSTHFGAFCLRE